MNKPILKDSNHVENHLDDKHPKWFAVYTPYKREKMADKYLSNLGIVTYLPIQEYTRKYIRKNKKVQLPLISHYVFVKITKRQYVKVLECPYVVNFVKFSKNLISIPEVEINLIKRILGEGMDIEITNEAFQKGDIVEVIGGNLTGLEGILIEKENNQYLSVRLTNIGFTINVSIAKHLLRKVKSSVLV